MRKEEVAQEHVFKVSLPEVRQTEHPTSSESPHPLLSSHWHTWAPQESRESKGMGLFR